MRREADGATDEKKTLINRLHRQYECIQRRKCEMFHISQHTVASVAVKLREDFSLVSRKIANKNRKGLLRKKKGPCSYFESPKE